MKGCEFKFWKKRWENFSCWLSFGVHSTSLLLQWHIKYSSHSAPWLNEVGVGWLCCCPGKVWETSSHTTHQETLGHSHLSSLSHWGTDPGLKSGISVCELISIKKKKKRRWGMNDISQKSLQVRKKPPPGNLSNLFYSPASSPHTFPSLGRRGKTPADHLALCGQSSLHINIFMSMRESLIAGFSTKGTLILASTVLQFGTLRRSTSLCDF